MPNEFTPIDTEEAFLAAVRERYGDIDGLRGQVNTLTGERDTAAKTVAELQAKVKGYEIGAIKARIAREKNIPHELADRLSGETEEDIRKDADAMAQIVRAAKGAPPLFDPEPSNPDAQTVDLKNMLHELRGE